MGQWYATREDVLSALDFKATSRDAAQLDQHLETGARAVDDLTHRRFYPQTRTQYYEWPTGLSPVRYRLWVDGPAQLVSLDSLTSAGVPITAEGYFLEPANDGPPFNRIELDRGGSAAFSGGATSQRSVAAHGVWGYDDVRKPATALSGSLGASTTATTVRVADGSRVGVGSLITVGTERMTLTERALVDSGVTITADLTDKAAANVITLSSAVGAPLAGETIAIDGEMMVVAYTTNSGARLVVRRSWDGSPLAAHTSGAAVLVGRSFTAERAVLGSSVAAHADGAAVEVQVYPGPVVDVNIAEAVVAYLNRSSGYARTSGSGDNERETASRGLAEARKRLLAYKRVRTAAV